MLGISTQIQSNAEALQINLEAFQANLNGSRILLQGPFKDKCPPILDSIQNIREPFKRRILLTSRQNSFTHAIQLQYDTIFRITNQIDWSLSLNYVQHLVGQTSGVPLLLIIEDLDVPDAFYIKLKNNVKITIIHYCSTPIKLKPNLGDLYNAVFFPFQFDFGTQQSQHILTVLQLLYRSGWTNAEFREIMAEIRVAGAGLCWSTVGGASSGGGWSKSGNIFWYDPVPTMRDYPMDKNMIAELLKWVANTIASAPSINSI
jgi:hypothetical protein